MMDERRKLILAAAALASGAAALAYEVVWTRKLALLLGVTSQAVSAGLALVMGGMALGAWLLGRAADRSRAPARLYAGLEAGIALSAVLSVPALDALVYGTLPLPLAALAAAVVILIPTALMGATLPALTRAAGGGATQAAGALYAANTFGAVAGTLLSSFALVEAVGLRRTAWAAAGLNVAAAALALACRGAAKPAPERAAAASGSPRAVMAAFAAAGFAALACEVLWTRYLIAVLGENSVHAFGMMLAAFLTGLALGSAVGTRVAEKTQRPVELMGIAMILFGAAALASVGVMSYLILNRPEGLEYWARTAANFRRCLAVLIVPTVLSGALFPLAVRAIVGSSGVGEGIGRLYAANTVGSVAGALAGGLLILPALGLRAGLAAVAVLQGAAGLALLASAGSGRRRWGAAASAAAVFAACGLAAWQSRDPARFVRGADRELVYLKDGPEATVSVVRSRLHRFLVLLVDWDDEAGTAPRQQIHLRLLGHLPALLHPDPKDGVVVGMGCGFTTGSMTQHPFERVQQIELSRAVVAAQPLFAPYNHDPLNQPKLELTVGDGRHVLKTTRRRYDVITSDPIDPDDRGVGVLYSKEYFELVRSRLKPGGIVSQWIPSEFHPDDFRLLVRTFLSVFPRTSVWFADGTSILVGQTAAPAVSLADMRRRFALPRVKASLAAIGIDSPEALLPLMVAGPAEAALLAGPGPINTDDRPLSEFRGKRSVADPRERESWELLAELGPVRYEEALARWTDQDLRACRPGLDALQAIFARLTRRAEVPAQGAGYEARALWHEEFSRRYLDLTWRIMRAPAAPLYRIMAGLDVDDAPIRAGLLEAAALQARAPERALDVLLRLDLDTRLAWPDLHAAPHRMVDRIIARIASNRGDAARLGRALLERLPEGRNRPAAQQAADAARWRLWWTDARFDCEASAGRFAWR